MTVQNADGSRSGSKKNRWLRIYKNRALSFIDIEIKFLEMQLSHPECGDMRHDDHIGAEASRLQSMEFRWAANLDKINLGEVLYGIFLTGGIRHINGAKAHFSELVTFVGQLLHIDLGNPREIRRAIIRRNRGKTPFLDTLRTLIIENCQ